MDTRQYAPYFQALDIIRQLEAKASMLEGLGETERVAAIRAKVEAHKAALPAAPPEPENHTAPIVQTITAKVEATAIVEPIIRDGIDMRKITGSDVYLPVVEKPTKKRGTSATE